MNIKAYIKDTSGSSPARRAAVLGVMCALAVAVSALEGLFPVIPVPGARPGLSNIVTMLTLSSMGFPAAMAVTIVKCSFALFRGGMAFMLSLAGGVLSTAVMAVLHKALRRHISFIGLGVAGAAIHNMGQLAAASAALGQSLLVLAPWLLLAGLGAGIITGLTLNILCGERGEG